MKKEKTKEKSLIDLLKNRKKTIEERVCVSCGHEAVNFKDELSSKEYKISGLCQTCQDQLFI